MLSEIVANLLAFADSAATPAFSEEEMDIGTPFCCVKHVLMQQVTRGVLTAG
ncbi:MAG: hypothetical protein AB3N21_07750 [Ruegeria sp.]|uniref:hypothetical protein n=1 Tax=Ruegeria sp. TaxID=1879320 RepID=UPI00349E6450